MILQKLPTSSAIKRRARTKSLIQLGGLLEHAGTLDVFNIPLSVDLQKDPSIKNNIAALFKALLLMNKMVEEEEWDFKILTLQGLQAFKDKGLSESRPLDRMKYKEFEAHSVNELTDHMASELVNDNDLSSRAQTDKLQEHSDFEKEEEKM